MNGSIVVNFSSVAPRLAIVLVAVGLWGTLPVYGQVTKTVGIVAEKPATGRFVETPRGFMVPYTMKIPGTDVEFTMEPVPGGEFLMGSPSGEAGRQANEGPQFRVKVEPFWMGKYEVRWEEYKRFMALYAAFKEFQTRRIRLVTEDNKADAITAPTELYEPSFTFEYGDDPQQPAVTMSQYAARQYTKWLTAITQQFYRLPTEAEWEYACRAGTSTAFSFGDDPSQLKEYGWFIDDIEEDGAQKIGQLKPNAFGLHDMHGNVAEWVLDELLDDGYQRFADKTLTVAEATVWPKKLFPRVVRGGSWQDEAKACRSAARMGSSDDEWRLEDPNLPLSPWWFTNDPARGIGFRLLRPLGDAPLEKEARERYWGIDAEETKLDVELRLEEGRGAQGIVDPNLPQAVKELDK